MIIGFFDLDEGDWWKRKVEVKPTGRDEHVNRGGQRIFYYGVSI